MVRNDERWDKELSHSSVFVLPSAWKNVFHNTKQLFIIFEQVYIHKEHITHFLWGILYHQSDDPV